MILVELNYIYPKLAGLIPVLSPMGMNQCILDFNDLLFTVFVFRGNVMNFLCTRPPAVFFFQNCDKKGFIVKYSSYKS